MRTGPSRRRLALVVAVATVTAISVAWVEAGSVDDRHQANRSDQLSRESSAHTAYAVVAQTPLDFAREAVVALHRYDTRFSRDTWRRELLSALGTADGTPGGRDVDRLIPDVAQWAQMAAVGQWATATIDTVYVPALWEQTTREHPELPDGATGVTVTGTQTVSWAGGSSRVPVAVTLLLLCPPATQRCAVSRITAQVAR